MSDTNNRSDSNIDEQMSEHESKSREQEKPPRSGLSRRQTLRAITGASLLPGVAIYSDIVAAQSGTIVDSEDSNSVSVTGTWPTSTYNSNYIGSNYRHDDNSGKGSKSVAYTPDLPSDGPYNVFLYWNSSSNRATSVPVDINYDGGSTTITVDQTTNGGQWNHIGTHQFTSGTGESVTIRNDGTNEFVIADAVNFACAILDSEDSSSVSITGSWTNSTYTSGYKGSNYKHDGNSAKGDKSVQYSPAIPADGDYTVSVWYTDGSNRATNTKIDIAGKSSTYTETLDQTQNGGQWVTLGTYTLDSMATVTIRNDNTDGYVVADAVKVEPTEGSGGDCSPSGTAEVLVNQGGYDLGRTKRFTAPGVSDGTTFEIQETCDGSSRYSGTVSGEKGDFSDFEPSNPGPYRIRLDKSGTTVRSNAFRVDDHVTELTSYRNAVEFFTGSRTKWGDYAALPSDDWNYPVSRGVAWRDQDGYSLIIRTLADLYMSNPEAMERITVDSSDVPPDLSSDAYQYKDMPTSVPSDTPEVVRLLWWGAHVYLKAGVNYSLMKTELAAFLRVYPHVDEWIPQSLYDDVYNHLFPIWDQSTGDKHYVDKYYYTDHSKDLTTTYTQVGTSKGEFPPGFSVRGNLDMYEVARREGRSDAQVYLDAAVEQAKWIVNNLDETDPMSHKGQRMSEHVTLTGLTRLVRDYPNEAPSGTWEWIESWASEMDALSDNLWDFRRWDLDTYWIHQQLPDYPSDGESINEPGNVAGFPAPALAAANVLDETNTSLADTLRDIAQAHVDNTFGRNPTGRHFCHRATKDAEGFEGVERGWYSEHDGVGDLNGVVGVLDGSPKDVHYPDNPEEGDVGWTEGWVAFNSAWNAGLSWLTLDDSSIAILDADGNDVDAVGASDTITISLRVAVDNDSSTQETVDTGLKVGSNAWDTVTLTQVTSTSSTHETTVDLDNRGASDGDTVNVRYGHGIFERTDSVAVGSADTTAPTAPSNLSSPAQSSSVELNWDASSDSGGSGLDHYDIYKDTKKDSQVAAGTTSTTITGLSAGTSYDFHVVAVDGADNESNDSDTITVSTGGSDAVVVDSEDSSGLSVTGTWPTSTYNSNYIGSNYRHDDNSGKGSKSVAYTPDLSSDGPYNVFLYWNSSSNRATSVPVDINYDGGSATTTVDQTANGGQWNHIGTHQFTSGTGESVTIRNDGTNDYVVADAVNFAPAMLDSEDSTGVSITGSWTNSTYASGYRGSNYKHDGDSRKGDRRVRYSPTIPADGDYTVSVWYTDGSNRATNTKIDIAGKSSTYTETLDQTQNGGQWVTLGTYTLDSTATVTIRNDNTDGYVVADAVKFVPA